MIDWLKYFFLSFFTDKYTDESHKRSLINAFFGLCLSVVVLLCLLFGGYSASMPAHYDAASAYRTAVYETVGDPAYTAKLENGKFSFLDGQGNAFLINTFSDENADECEFILDTRDIKSSFVEFTVQYADAEGNTITYEAYLALSDEEKNNYAFTTEYSNELLQFTDEKLTAFETYLSTVTDEELQKSYADLMAGKAELNGDEYANKLYELYVTAYYPSDVRSLDIYSFAPTLRTYYDKLISQATDAQFFALYDDLVYARFTDEHEVVYILTGLAEKLDDRVISASDTAQLQNNIDRLMKDALDASTSYIFIEYVFNFMRMLPILIVGALLVAVIPWLIFKFTKTPKLTAYLTSFKIVNLYGLVAALASGIVGFILSWFMGRNGTYQISLICFAAIVIVRFAVYIVCALIRNRKPQQELS